MALDDLTVLIDDRRDGVERNFKALVGQNGVGVRELDRRDFNATKDDRWVGWQILKSELFGHVMDPFEADLVGEARGRGIEGLFKCKFECHSAKIAVFIIVGCPGRVAELPGERGVLDIASRQVTPRAALESFLQRREIGNRLEGRAGLAFRLSNAIELTFAVVAATDHSTDFPSLRLDRDQARLQLLLFFLAPQLRMMRLKIGQIIGDGLLGFLLRMYFESSKDTQSLAG